MRRAPYVTDTLWHCVERNVELLSTFLNLTGGIQILFERICFIIMITWLQAIVFLSICRPSDYPRIFLEEFIP